jgi:hypothetical protein
MSENGEIKVQDLESLTSDFKNAGTAEDGAKAFVAIVDYAHRVELSERSKVSRVGDVVEYLKPEGEIQIAAVNLAKRGMNFEGPHLFAQ